jgi:hypothetical protein
VILLFYIFFAKHFSKVVSVINYFLLFVILVMIVTMEIYYNVNKTK